jgi:uncharacterized protein
MSDITAGHAPGTPAWVDLVTARPREAASFYGSLLGWTFGTADDGAVKYLMASVRGLNVASVGEPAGPAAPGWTAHIVVDDIDAALERVRSGGGTVLFGPIDINGDVRMAAVLDPAGVRLGLFQAQGHFGAEVVDEPGAACWYELRTASADTVSSFYCSVFGYPPGNGLLRAEGRPVAEIVASQDIPGWLVHFGVEDVDTATTLAVSLGGDILAGPVDTPRGRRAVLADPHGARFAVVKS